MEVKSWKYCNLSDVSTKIGSGVTPRGGEKVYQKSGHPLVRSQNVGWGVLLLKDIAYINSDIHESMRSTKLELGDVLLNITGASIGRSAVVDSSIVDGNVNQHVCIIRTKETEVNPYYLNQYLISHYGQKQIESFQSGGNRQGLNIAQIHTFKIPLPPLQEQQKIATILSKWDELIESQTRLIKAKEKQKTSLMQKLLTGEVRFPGFEDEWEEKTMSDVAEVKRGAGSQYITYVDKEDLHAIRLIRISDFLGDDPKYILKTEHTDRFLLKEGDLLIAGTGATAGITFEAPKYFSNMVFSYNAPRIRVGKGIMKEYLIQFLKSDIILKQQLALFTGNAQPFLDITAIGGFEIKIPSFQEQHKIASVLSTCDEELQSLKDELEAIKLQKKGLMQQFLTGKIRVKV